MSVVRDLTILILSIICLCIILALNKILHKLWWTPTRIKHLMNSQGVEGPSYRFMHGSTKEIIAMHKEAMARPLGLSNNIFPKLLPHVHYWTNLYGNTNSRHFSYLGFYFHEDFLLLMNSILFFIIQERIIFSGMVLNLNWLLLNPS